MDYSSEEVEREYRQRIKNMVQEDGIPEPIAEYLMDLYKENDLLKARVSELEGSQ